MIKQKTVKKRGGARPGAGRKRILEGARASLMDIDDPTRVVLTDLGEGTLARGVRIAAIMINLLPLPEWERLLKRAREIEEENIKRVRDSQKKERIS